MAGLTVETTRYIDFYQMQDKYGNNYVQAHRLAFVDSNGILTESLVKADSLTDAQKSAMEANGVKFDNFGTAYFETENLSRFLHYGVDSNGTLYAFNYAGEKMRVDSDGTLSPPTPGDTFASDTKGTFLSEIKATYNLDWNGVSATGLSLSRVIMLITLIRAERIEEQLVEQMDKLAERTALLQGSADAEQFVLDKYSDTIKNDTTFQSHAEPNGGGVYFISIKYYLETELGLSLTFPAEGAAWSQSFKDEVIAAIQTKQDELNTISQETSINIQSLINKRDQAYLLGTNAIGLFYSGHISVARNM